MIMVMNIWVLLNQRSNYQDLKTHRRLNGIIPLSLNWSRYVKHVHGYSDVNKARSGSIFNDHEYTVYL
jgi:hypothetical protein